MIVSAGRESWLNHYIKSQLSVVLNPLQTQPELLLYFQKRLLDPLSAVQSVGYHHKTLTHNSSLCQVELS